MRSVGQTSNLKRNDLGNVPHGTIKAAHGLEVVGGSFLGGGWANCHGKIKAKK